jgi:hypothetical protein
MIANESFENVAKFRYMRTMEIKKTAFTNKLKAD